MASTIEIRMAASADALAASQLVRESFNVLAASDWEPSAQKVFLADAASDALAAKIASSAFSALACSAAQAVGFLLMPTPAVLGMLFVDPKWVHRGIGTALWENARDFVEENWSDTKTIELNSTPYAMPFYRSVGFMPISREFEQAGCRATRMACWLPQRHLESPYGRVSKCPR